jgi:hypothetical protein
MPAGSSGLHRLDGCTESRGVSSREEMSSPGSRLRVRLRIFSGEIATACHQGKLILITELTDKNSLLCRLNIGEGALCVKDILTLYL